MEFAGQAAIVTGAARGFGRAIVRRLAWAGARLVVGTPQTGQLVNWSSGRLAGPISKTD